jgi:ABC-type transport system involved in multi-copper enzyme maturation permease subunit
MSGSGEAVAHNAQWELTRLRRSRRIWLLLIPVVAGPVGSAIADLYLQVPTPGTAQVLGLLILAGLSALVVLDLTALAVGEDLALRTQYLTFALPQSRSAALGGRLLVVIGGTVGMYCLGALGVLLLASQLVSASPLAAAPILPPVHLAFGLVGLLLFLGGVTAAAGVVTRSASQALVAGILAGVVAAGLGSLFLIDGQLTTGFPVALGVVGVAGLGLCLVQYSQIDG